MQTLTFTQKLLRQRNFLSSLIPLLALFLGLGSANTANAQAPTQGASQATILNVVIKAGTTTANATTDTYDAIASTGGTVIGGGIFGGTNFGALDVNSGQLLLQGGTVQVVEQGGEGVEDGVRDEFFELLLQEFGGGEADGAQDGGAG